MSLFVMLGWVVGALFAVAAILVTIRMVRGRSLLDRMIASDVLLTTVILVLGAEMVINEHTDNLVLMVVIAAVASFAAIAVARTISKQDRQPDWDEAHASSPGDPDDADDMDEVDDPDDSDDADDATVAQEEAR